MSRTCAVRTWRRWCPRAASTPIAGRGAGGSPDALPPATGSLSSPRGGAVHPRVDLRRLRPTGGHRDRAGGVDKHPVPGRVATPLAGGYRHRIVGGHVSGDHHVPRSDVTIHVRDGEPRELGGEGEAGSVTVTVPSGAHRCGKCRRHWPGFPSLEDVHLQTTRCRSGNSRSPTFLLSHTGGGPGPGPGPRAHVRVAPMTRPGGRPPATREEPGIAATCRASCDLAGSASQARRTSRVAGRVWPVQTPPASKPRHPRSRGPGRRNCRAGPRAASASLPGEGADHAGVR